MFWQKKDNLYFFQLCEKEDGGVGPVMISQCTMHGNDSCSKLDQIGNSVFITMPSWKAEDEGLFEASRVNFDASKLSIEFTYNTISRYNLPIQKLDLQIP